MPEAPELDAAAAFLRERTVGRTIERIDLGSFSVLKTADPPHTALVGARITDVGRRGKFLLLSCADAGSAADADVHLAVHLARAGWLRWHATNPKTVVKPGRGPLALRLVLDSGSSVDVTEAGTKKGVAAYVTADPATLPEIARLGPEAGRLSVEDLAAILAGTGSRIKTVITDQALMAGIGNGFSDDILHAARLSPYATAKALDLDEVTRLHTAIGQVLGTAAEAMAGRPLDRIKDIKHAGYRVHARTGVPCPVCGTDIAEVSFAERSLQYCPTCQTGGRRLSDRRMDRLLK
ncbi:DNA-formamidopyrimidine glycosylase family protein [Raineyella sp. LH-20]|uniref:DNA-formamidopyrimidine glycosylase family protein n=1 Tax=Raineyella sp. LH-20 TaxID=3081204 RepID=UPI002953DD31|nr:DNA-formamidopyrimidine glycosylase family protein [Raineyella sp. LH-20]WOP17513.1 DNA-formamidopyrimidine glycosylase family protein [Raineyella sp. LH-20]